MVWSCEVGALGWNETEKVTMVLQWFGHVKWEL